MTKDIKEILLTEEQITNKVKEIGKAISEDYKGKDLIIVGILKGSVIFASELIKNISIPCEIDFMAVSSYGNSTETSGVVRILKDLDHGIEGKDIIIVEDIIDSGLTLSNLTRELQARGPKALKICTLLDKPERRKADIPVDYVGFVIEDKFIVGYGIDYAEKYRNLPYIGIVEDV